MKKAFILFGAILAFAIAVGCTAGRSTDSSARKPVSGDTLLSDGTDSEPIAENTESINYIVIVNGTQQGISVKDAKFPVFDLLCICGVTLSWKDHNNASFSLHGKTYLVNIADVSICEEGSQFNLLTVPPGTEDGFITCVGSNIFVDYDTLKSMLALLKIDASVTQAS